VVYPLLLASKIKMMSRSPASIEFTILCASAGLSTIACDGNISITRLGDKLIDTWANGEPSNFSPASTIRSSPGKTVGWKGFLRDKSGNVTGILYTPTDGEFEAKRLS
jgi:hypothetical protein